MICRHFTDFAQVNDDFFLKVTNNVSKIVLAELLFHIVTCLLKENVLKGEEPCSSMRRRLDTKPDEKFHKGYKKFWHCRQLIVHILMVKIAL